MDREEKIIYLENLYRRDSKHSQYQSLPESLRKLLPDITMVTKWEKERLDYISQVLNITGKRILDIGGNTGYFSFGVIDKGAESVDYYEGNQAHADFVKIAAEILETQNLNIYPDYYLFPRGMLLNKFSSKEDLPSEKKYDIVFCLNVVHHFGDDYGKASDIDMAKEKMLACINSLSEITTWLVFQMGFNWCGNKEKPLFLNGLKAEMEQFIRRGTKEKFSIEKIGVPVRSGNGIAYEDKNMENCGRDDRMGEFLNRPLFILKSVD